ncbi:hypothetical protein, partial [Enterobacter hormaechei]
MQAQRRPANQATMRPGGLNPAQTHTHRDKTKTLIPFQSLKQKNNHTKNTQEKRNPILSLKK